MSSLHFASVGLSQPCVVQDQVEASGHVLEFTALRPKQAANCSLKSCLDHSNMSNAAFLQASQSREAGRDYIYRLVMKRCRPAKALEPSALLCRCP